MRAAVCWSCIGFLLYFYKIGRGINLERKVELLSKFWVDLDTKRKDSGLLRRVVTSNKMFDCEEISWRAVVEYCHQQGGEKSKRISEPLRVDSFQSSEGNSHSPTDSFNEKINPREPEEFSLCCLSEKSIRHFPSASSERPSTFSPHLRAL